MIKLRQSKQTKISHAGGGGGRSQQMSGVGLTELPVVARRGGIRSCFSRYSEIRVLTILHPEIYDIRYTYTQV